MRKKVLIYQIERCFSCRKVEAGIEADGGATKSSMQMESRAVRPLVRFSGSFQAGPEPAAKKCPLRNHDHQDPRRTYKSDISERLVPSGGISINCT